MAMELDRLEKERREGQSAQTIVDTQDNEDVDITAHMADTQEKHKNVYFWRTHKKEEIDYLEEEGGILNAFKFKFNRMKSKKIKIPLEFKDTYKQSNFKVIDRNNFSEFI